MKKVVSIALLLTASIFFNACDYVNNAVEGKQTSNTGGGGQSTIIYRKVLVEDYTGHKCGNCPAAADQLKIIEANHPGTVIPIAVHAGGFAATNSLYPTDFRTPEGDTYDGTFGISGGAGNPNGLVNRKGYGTPDFIEAYTLWETNASPYLTMEAAFKISITNSFNTSNNQVSSAVTVTANQAVSGKYNLSVLMVEDSIIAEQLDYRLPNGQQRVPDYLFMHVLRGSLNSVWGEEVLNGAWVKGDSIVKTYNNYQIPSPVVPKHCKIIAFVYNADNLSASYYEVMQVEEAEVTHQ